MISGGCISGFCVGLYFLLSECVCDFGWLIHSLDRVFLRLVARSLFPWLPCRLLNRLPTRSLNLTTRGSTRGYLSTIAPLWLEQWGKLGVARCYVAKVRQGSQIRNFLKKKLEQFRLVAGVSDGWWG